MSGLKKIEALAGAENKQIAKPAGLPRRAFAFEGTSGPDGLQEFFNGPLRNQTFSVDFD